MKAYVLRCVTTLLMVALSLGQQVPDELILTEIPDHYGNDIVDRGDNVDTGAQKTYIDTESVLPQGKLRHFYAYIHGLETHTTVRLQIWRPQWETPNTYQLVWEARVSFNISQKDTVLDYTPAYEDTAMISAGDMIGWTNEGEISPISFEYSEEHETYFREVPNGKFPEIYESYEFHNTYLARKFSVGVHVVPDVIPASAPLQLGVTSLWLVILAFSLYLH